MADFVWIGKYMVNCEGLACIELVDIACAELFYANGSFFTLDFDSQEERDRALKMVSEI